MTEQRVLQAGAFGLPWTVVAPPGVFRLLLAFAVVLSHISAIEVGRLAVTLFFYLSGYWTACIWQEKFESKRLGWFYLSRYWRVAPLFLVVTLACAAVRQSELHWVNFTLLGIGSSDNDPTGVSWSLDVELQFYLLLPLLMGVLIAAPRWAFAGSLGVAALGVWLDTRYEITTVAKYLPAFLLGSLTYVKAWKPTARAAHLSLGAFGAFTLLTMLTPFFSKALPNPFDEDVWALLWMAPLLPYVAYSLTIRSSKLDRHLGNLSYPLYLVHFATIAVMTAQFGASLPIKGAAVALSCVLALLVYWCVDRPIDRIRVKVTERPRTPPSTE